MISQALAKRPDPLALILKVGLFAGTLDITDALVYSYVRGVAPARVFQYIARLDRDTRLPAGHQLRCSWPDTSLCNRAGMDGTLLPDKSKVRDLAPSADNQRDGVRCRRLLIYEPRGSAIVGCTASHQTYDFSVADQWCAGGRALHRVDHLVVDSPQHVFNLRTDVHSDNCL